MLICFVALLPFLRRAHDSLYNTVMVSCHSELVELRTMRASHLNLFEQPLKNAHMGGLAKEKIRK